MEARLIEAEFMHGNIRTDVANLIGPIAAFAKANNCRSIFLRLDENKQQIPMT
jgi:hypothetical protein